MSNLSYFLIRRIHSLSGVIPLGAFLFAHLTTNAMAAFGQEAFAHKVGLIHSLGPLLPFVEAAFIFVPLAVHIVLGIVIALTGRSNTGDLGYARNWAYTLQRWTGWAALAFILYHTITLRFMDTAGTAKFGGGELTAGDVFFLYLTEQFQNPLFILIYLVGSAAVIYHFANGLCTFCMTWGLTVGPKSQKTMAAIATVVGLGLFGMVGASIAGFYGHYDEAKVKAMRAGEMALPKH